MAILKSNPLYGCHAENSQSVINNQFNSHLIKQSFFVLATLILIVGFTLQANAQIESSFEDINAHGVSIPTKSFAGIQANYYYNSNAVTNQFFSSLYQGQYIDSTLKNAVIDKLAAKNRVGGEFNFSIFAKICPDSGSSKNTYWFKIGEKNIAGFSFSNNMFKLIFNGNSQFAGQNIDLGKSVLNSIQYQYLTGGIEKTIGENHNMIVGAGLSLIKGSNHLNIAIDKAVLFTQQDGEYLDLDLNYGLKQTDTSNTGYASFNGFGTGLDLYYRLMLKNQSQLNISASDIGFIHWNGNSLQSSADTTYHFEGLEINNIFQLIDTASTDQNLQDTIVNGFIPKTKQKSYNSMLPTQIHFNYLHHIGSTSFYATVGIKYMFNAGYFPKTYIGGAWYTKSFDVITSVSYGGYTNISWDLRLRKTFLKTFEIYAGCNNLLGYIIPKSTTSQGAYVALSKYF